MNKSNESTQNKVKISVITPSFNGAQFLESTLTSVSMQTCKDFEHIVIDGGSTDGTVEILKKHPNIRYISEKDKGYHDAVLKGVAMAKGEYITVCMVSDGYVNNSWFEQCLKIFESDPEVSLVWGFPQWMTEKGELRDVSYPYFHTKIPPQKQGWFAYWLATGEPFPDGNFMVRANVYKKCIPPLSETQKGREYFDFNYNLNSNGYLPFNIPIVANYGREHEGQLSKQWMKNGFYKIAMQQYSDKMLRYEHDLRLGQKVHVFRDGKGSVLKDSSVVKMPSYFMKKRTRFLIMLSVIKQRGPYKIIQLLRRYGWHIK
jgi:glycosyltransferase involved in cell wall biosynthesis